MQPHELPDIRLSVWRPLRWSRQYLDVKQGEPADLSSFHEQIYHWEMQESLFDAIEDPTKAEEIRSELIDTFLPIKDPSERGIKTLEGAVRLLDKIFDSGTSSWTDSGQEREYPDNDKLPVCIRQQRLIAFRWRLQWVCDTFCDVPGASITLR